MNRSLLKANAKESLQGNWGIAILALLISTVLIGAAASVMGIGELIVIGPFETGVALIFLKLCYRERTDVGDLFQPFQNFVNTFFAGFLSQLFIFLWSLLLIVPGIIKGLAYSQVFYLMNDHPEYTGKEAINASQEMMKGHKGELFLLQLSFIGWFLLSCLTLGILQFYVLPYYQATMTEYYRYLKESQSGSEENWNGEEQARVSYDPEVNA